MPAYEYLCNDCGPFTDMRPMAVDDQPLIPRVRRGGYSLIELGLFALAPVTVVATAEFRFRRRRISKRAQHRCH